MVIPVEIWDLPVAGKLLQEWRDDSSFPERVAEVAVSAGTLRDWDDAIARALSAIRHVHLAGGGATAAIEEAIAARGPSCTRDGDPFTAARFGARTHGLCADIGQTSIKLARVGTTPSAGLAGVAGPLDRSDTPTDVAGTREVDAGVNVYRILRDLARAPMRDEVPLDQRDAARTSTIDFLASLLARARTALVALPCEIIAGVPRSCSYCWRDPDPDLVPDLARRSGAAIDIVNDAVLAAHAAPVPRDATLVLTIGFGVGGAILLP